MKAGPYLFLWPGKKKNAAKARSPKTVILRSGKELIKLHAGNARDSNVSGIIFLSRHPKAELEFDSQIAASVTWSNKQTLLITFRFIQTTHSDNLTTVFDGDRIRIKFLFSVARLEKKPDDRQDLTGKMG